MSHIKNRPILGFLLAKKQVVASAGLAKPDPEDSPIRGGIPTQIFLLVLIYSFACLLTGCSTTAWNRPIWELALPGYKPPGATEPHATLVLSRSTPNIFVHIDGALVKDESLSLRLNVSPGTRKVSIERSDGSSFSNPIKQKLEFKEGALITIDAWLESQGVAVRIKEVKHGD